MNPLESHALEQNMIAWCLIENYQRRHIVDKIGRAQVFSHVIWRVAWEAIVNFDKEEKPINNFSVHRYVLAKVSIDEIVVHFGSADALLTELSNFTSTFSNEAIETLIELARRRWALKAAQELQMHALDMNKSIDLGIAGAITQLNAIGEQHDQEYFIKIGEVVPEMTKQIVYAMDHRDEINGIPTGIKALDRKTWGFQNTNLILVVARPGVGKTAWMLSFARHAALAGFAGAIANYEMANMQMSYRMLASEAQISGNSIKRGHLNDQDWAVVQKSLESIKELPIWMSDHTDFDVLKLGAEMRMLIHKHKIRWLAIDYIQLMPGDEDYEHQRVSRISRELKLLAKMLNIPVIALGQLTRAAAEGKPALHHLRSSGSLEQDADQIFALHELIQHDPNDPNQHQSNERLIQFLTLKNREGDLDPINLKAIMDKNLLQEDNRPILPSSLEHSGKDKAADGAEVVKEARQLEMKAAQEASAGGATLPVKGPDISGADEDDLPF